MDRVYKEHGKHVGKALTPLVDFDISVVVENHTYIRIGGGVKDGILCFFRSNRPLLKQSVFPIGESHCCRFSVRRFSHFSDQEKPTERNRLAICPYFWKNRLDGAIGFSCPKRTSLVTTCCLMQEPQPYRIDARGRAQAEVGLLLVLTRGQAGVEVSLYVWSCGGSSQQQSQSCDPAAVHQGRAVFPPTEIARRQNIAVQKSAVRPCMYSRETFLAVPGTNVYHSD